MKKLKLKKSISKMKNQIDTKLKKKKSEHQTKVKSKKAKNAFLSILMIFGIVLATCTLAFGLYIIFTAPDFDATKLYNKEATVLYDRKGQEITRYGKENRVKVTYNDLPQVFVDALVATEDSRFFQHNGFDAARFLKASIGQAAGNSSAGGASTLTMQLVKNTYTSNEASGIKGLIRKFTDIYMSIFKIEKKYTKEEILEFYVNSQEFGIGGTNYGSINGVEQASQYYFGKGIADLTLAESSLLVGLFNNPYLYNPYKNPEGCTNRRSVVLGLMVKHGYITEEQKIEAEKITVQSLLKAKDLNTKQNPYQAFIDYVIDEVKEKTGVNPFIVPMAIYTTLDMDMQNVVNDVQNGNGYKFRDDKDDVGIAIANVEDGSLLAMSGGRNYVPQGINRADIRRQPGSTAKPIFDYGPIIEYNNVSTVHPFFDEPYSYTTGGSINNYDSKYWGLSNMHDVLVDSRNVPAVQAFQQVDKSKIAEFVHNLGIDYGENLYESAAIGGFTGISPIESAAAFSAFARGGYYIEPYAYTKIVYLENEKTEEYKPTKKRVMSEETAYMINSILVDTARAGGGGNLRTSGTEIAVKTGTTNITDKDADALGIRRSVGATPDHWNVSYTTDYCVSLWYGYDPISKDHYLTSQSGTIGRKRIMEAIANKIYLPNKTFSKPDGVISVELEKETFPYQLPSEFTPSDLRIKGYYKKGTEPTEVSKRFSQLENPTNIRSEVKDNKVTISWDPIKTPDAINTSSLTEYFNANYSQWATKYYNLRINYNNSRIGTNGYQVYLQNSNGSLTSLGFTNNNYYSYTPSGSGTEYTFVVKSAYSIFKSNMSSGVSVKAKVSGNSGNTNDLTLALNGNSAVCVKVGEKFVDLKTPLKVTYEGKDVTSESTITVDTNIDTSAPKQTQITYKVTYKDKTNTIKRTINVCTSCNSDGTSCAT